MREGRVLKEGAARRRGDCDLGGAVRGRWALGGGRGQNEAGGRWAEGARWARARALGARVWRAREQRPLGARARRTRRARAWGRGCGGPRSGGHWCEGAEGTRVRGLVGGGCQIRDPDILVQCWCKKTWRGMWRPVMAEARASPTRVLPVLNA